MSSLLALLPVLLKIISHFLENKTPEAKKAYVQNLDQMSKALAADDVNSVNDLFIQLRDETREGDTFGIDTKTKP